MTQNNLLDSTADQLTIDENKDWLSEYVGEGKKYATVQDLAKAKAYADRHISTVEAENSELIANALRMKEETAAGAKLQELLDKLDAQQQLLASRETTLNSNEDTKPSLKLDDVESLVSTKLQQHEQNRRETENYNQVKAKLAERFGTNFKDVLKEKSNSLGLTDDEVNAMARKNPNLFMKTFDLNAPADTFQAPPRTSSGFTPKAPKKHLKWSDYLEMKKKDPKAWMDKNIAVQMEKDSQALGEAFYDI